MSCSLVLSFAVIALIMYIGEVVSIKSGGKLPQMFIVAIIFLVGYWYIFPKDVIDTSGLTVASNIMKLFILIHVGAMFDIKQIMKDWRVVVTTIAAMIGLTLLVLPIGSLIFGKTMTLVAVPPLTGGGMAAMIMSDGAIAIGKPDLGMLAMIIFIMQGFVGFPLTAYFLNKEGNRLVDDFRKNPSKYEATAKDEAAADINVEKNTKKKKRIIEMTPQHYKTYTFYLAQLGLLALVVDFIYKAMGGAIDKSLLAVFIGIIAVQIGILESNPIGKAQSDGVLTMALFVSFMASFKTATPQLIGALLIPIVSLLAIATVGILLASIPVGKKLGYSKYMSAAIGLNCFLGFPYNYALTNEAVRAISKTKEEATYLTDEMMPKMIIGSIIAVSLVSTLFAGILVKFL